MNLNFLSIKVRKPGIAGRARTLLPCSPVVLLLYVTARHSDSSLLCGEIGDERQSTNLETQVAFESAVRGRRIDSVLPIGGLSTVLEQCRYLSVLRSSSWQSDRVPNQVWKPLHSPQWLLGTKILDGINCIPYLPYLPVTSNSVIATGKCGACCDLLSQSAG